MGNKYLVIIEWAGATPPGSWYRRLDRLATLSARQGDASDRKEAAESTSLGFAIQEGTIACSSYSLARTIAALATQGIEVASKGGVTVMKPAFVTIGEMAMENFKVVADDYKALERLQAVVGKRGKRAKATDQVVTCYEECTTVEERTVAVIGCPNCGATNIAHRPGTIHRFADPGGDIMTAWVRTRFASGQWERPLAGDEMPPATVHLRHRGENEFVETLRTSPLLTQIAGVSRCRAFALLDAALVARVHWTEAQRLKARMAAVVALVQMGGGELLDISLAEVPGSIDILDTAGPLGADAAAAMAFHSGGKDAARGNAKARDSRGASVGKSGLPNFVPAVAPSATRGAYGALGTH